MDPTLAVLFQDIWTSMVRCNSARNRHPLPVSSVAALRLSSNRRLRWPLPKDRHALDVRSAAVLASTGLGRWRRKSFSGRSAAD